MKKIYLKINLNNKFKFELKFKYKLHITETFLKFLNYKLDNFTFFNNLKNWLNYLLSDYLKNGEYIDYDLSGADELKDDIGDIIQKLEPLKNRVTINEYRRIISTLTDLSLEQLKGGDVLLVGGGDMTLDEVTEPTTTEGEKEEDV